MKLQDRLRGIYRIPITDGLGAVGSGEEPDNPDEFVRKFDTPPIQHEAADLLDRYEAAIQIYDEAFEKVWLFLLHADPTHIDLSHEKITASYHDMKSKAKILKEELWPVREIADHPIKDDF